MNLSTDPAVAPLDSASCWQVQLREAVTSLKQLKGQGFRFLDSLNWENLPDLEDKFRVLVPRYYLGLIDKSDPKDPIAMMAFPREEELIVSPGFFADPIGDLTKNVAPRLTHRYKDRALLHTTNLCPMYCRFCFRKNLMNEREERLYLGEFREAFEYIQKHPEIEEVILTGGDPWMLSDDKLKSLVQEIDSKLLNVHRLRFHTRMPVTLPNRIQNGLLDVLRTLKRVKPIVVTHFNHPREITLEAKAGVEKLLDARVLVLNQSVLLKGVNDQRETLLQLFRELGNSGVLPYYLHQCDQVSGAEHFQVPMPQGKALWDSLRGELAGYLIPEFVRDRAEGLGKIPVSIEKINSMNIV